MYTGSLITRFRVGLRRNTTTLQAPAEHKVRNLQNISWKTGIWHRRHRHHLHENAFSESAVCCSPAVCYAEDLPRNYGQIWQEEALGGIALIYCSEASALVVGLNCLRLRSRCPLLCCFPTGVDAQRYE